MAVPLDKFVQQIEDSGIILPDTLKDFIPPKASPKDAEELAKELIRQKKLTKFQAEEISKGKGKSLTLGNYVLLEKIGAGGMGQVFKAEHRRMHRMVAIKLLPPAMTKDNAAIARFEREVTAAAKLRHPNIVAADDADCANGVHFLVMEMVEGQDLSALVKKNGPFSVETAVNYVLQAAKGLEFAHKKGIVHRDIKPANLLLDSEGTVKILDMGLARLHGDGDSPQQADLTSTGTIMGTVDYMSPEQALDTKTADARADVYALGCSLFYLLTGKPTYDGDTLMKKLLAHREQPIPSLRSVRAEMPESVEVIFKKMVAKKVDDRYQTMTDVIHDLEGCSGQLSSTSMNVLRTTENTLFNSTPKTVDLQPPTSLNGTQPRQVTATLTAADVAAEATMLTGDGLQVTNPQTQSVAASLAGQSSEAKQKSAPPSWWKDRRVQIGGGLAALLILFAGIVISLKTKHGTLIVEVDQADAMVQVLDAEGKVEISQKGGGGKVTIIVDPGKKRLKVEKDGFTTFGQEFEMQKNGTKEITAKLVPVDEKPVVAAARKPFAYETPGFDQWVKDVQAMPAEKQVEAVSKKLVELNPGFDGVLNPIFENDVVAGLRFATENVSDMSPVRALVGLVAIECIDRWPLGSGLGDGKLSDLSQLKGMKLRFLCIGKNPSVTNLSPLAEVPLTLLSVFGTRVSDLTPLKGMNLTYISLADTRVSDLSPLRGMSLDYVDCNITQVSDLSPLEGMPLQEFSCNRTPVFDLSPLRKSKIKKLSIDETRVSDLSPLAGMPLADLSCTYSRVSDLTPLKGMNLTRISVGFTRVSDLSPLSGMPLTFVDCNVTQVSDLSPLQGMPLTQLWFNETLVSDLSPIKGMPLESLWFTSTPVKDLSPLKGMPLKELWFDFKPERDTELIRSITTLETINKKPVAEFWKEVERMSVKNPLFFQTPGFDDWAKQVAAMPAEQQVEAVSRKLMELNPGFDGIGMSRYSIRQGVVDEVGFSTTKVTDISPVRALTHLDLLICSDDVEFKRGKLTDLSPLRGMKLRRLECSNNPIKSLSPLEGMPLTMLNCINTSVSDITPLRSMRLTECAIGGTRVSDLSPLRGMKLTTLNIWATSVSDLSPLEDMPLTDLTINDTSVSDLSALKGMSLRKIQFTPKTITQGIPVLRQMKSLDKIGLQFGKEFTVDEFWKKYDAGEFGKPEQPLKPISDFNSPAFQQWVKDVQTMSAEQQLEAVSRKLMELNPGFDGKITGPNGGPPEFKNGVVWEIGLIPSNVTDISPLRAFKGLAGLSCYVGKSGTRTMVLGELADLTPLKGMQLNYFNCSGTKVVDLSPLKGMPLWMLYCECPGLSDLTPLKGMPLHTIGVAGTKISDLSPLKDTKLTSLNCTDTFVTDLSPLKGMPLTYFQANVTRISDLSPLQGMPLKHLECGYSRVSDISVVRGMPLEQLVCIGNNIADLSPLKDTPLKSLHCDLKSQRDFEIVRTIKTLKEINGKPAADFWKEVEEQQIGKKLGFEMPGFDQWVKEVQNMPAEKQVEAVSKRLMELNPGFDGKINGRDQNGPPIVEQGVVKVVYLDPGKVADLSPLRAFKGLTALNCGGSGARGRGKVRDLSPLRGMSLTAISIYTTSVDDLSPLRDMPIKYLECSDVPVSDLSPLVGMPLTQLFLTGTKVSDLTPLHSCQQLQLLKVRLTKVTASTVSALKQALPNCKIEWDDPSNAATQSPQ
ncbi:MAG: protein kinase [Planctomycetes bacterium]|nr:protein kinase [Planctomycetota bacterium]